MWSGKLAPVSERLRPTVTLDASPMSSAPPADRVRSFAAEIRCSAVSVGRSRSPPAVMLMLPPALVAVLTVVAVLVSPLL